MDFFQKFVDIQAIENQYSMHKVMTIKIKDFFSNLVTFTEEILNENFFFCAVISRKFISFNFY